MPKALGIYPWLDEPFWVFAHLIQRIDFPALYCFRGKVKWSKNRTNSSYLQGFKSQLREKKLQPESIPTDCADNRQFLERLTRRELNFPLSVTPQDAQEYVAFLRHATHAPLARKIGAYSPELRRHSPFKIHPHANLQSPIGRDPGDSPGRGLYLGMHLPGSGARPQACHILLAAGQMR